MGELTLDAIQKMMEAMCEKYEKRMEEMINKIAPSSSNSSNNIPLVDENGVPIPPKDGGASN